ncbi:MAG: hypothetical protein JNL28_16410 [Planctomycetes bacterium]|nr:hypothetical protein [Planctomycetota bacterium]
MNFKKPGIWLGLASALLVVAFVVWDSKRLSPGDLSAVHMHAKASLADDCEACHGRPGESMADACASCHAEVTAQLSSQTGFHGTMTADASRCGPCHSEHHGSEHPIVSDAIFAMAGVADRDRFDHAGLAFALEGAHTGLACERCHAHANDRVLAAGTRRFLGASQACADCHEDPHAGRLPDCASCHGQTQPFKTVAAFEHPRSFLLVGRHAQAGCLECHAKDSPYAIEASGVLGGSGKSTRESRACSACHESPHAPDFITQIGTTLVVAAEASCVECHQPDDQSFERPPARMDATLHALAGFPLEPPHHEAQCEQCHSAGPMLASAPVTATVKQRFAALHPGRQPDECKACHVDPHAGQFEEGHFAGQNCRACHAELAFTPPAFTLADHARTQFPLTGTHEALACAACHTQPSPTAPRQFHGTATDCASCHVDAHRGFFDRAGVPAIFNGEAGCARCHDTNTFGPVATKPFDHEHWTGFALLGAHARGACTDCHARTTVADSAGRTFGRVADTFDGPADQCATCHADVHWGQFDRAGLAQQTASGTGCARCHDVESFAGARASFAHATWTPFALTGAHARADCEVCHERRPKPDRNGRSFGVVAERFTGPTDRCETCHVDVHDGAFDKQQIPSPPGAARGCERCHTTESFQGVAKQAFDHGRWTGFALDGLHASVVCADCHAPTVADTAAGRSFGRARGTSCQACHADPHVGQFAVDKVTDCARCHTVNSPFTKPDFDHDRDSRFALDDTHAALACSSCHISASLSNGDTAIRYKPLGTACADCHAPATR